MKNRVICIVLAAIVLISACFVACSGKKHTENEKEVTVTDTDGNLITTTQDVGAVTVIQNVTNESGKVIGTKKVNMPTTIIDGKVMVTRVEKVTDKNGNKQTTVIYQQIKDKDGNPLTVTSTTKKPGDKKDPSSTAAGDKTASTGTTKKDKTTKPNGKKPQKTSATTTSDPCTTTDTFYDLPEDVFDDDYLLTEYNGQLYLQNRFDAIENGRYIVNFDADKSKGDKAHYTVYIPRPNNEKGHLVYSTVVVNLKNGKATETNAETKKKTKYNVMDELTTTTTTTTTKKSK